MGISIRNPMKFSVLDENFGLARLLGCFFDFLCVFWKFSLPSYEWIVFWSLTPLVTTIEGFHEWAGHSVWFYCTCRSEHARRVHGCPWISICMQHLGVSDFHTAFSIDRLIWLLKWKCKNPRIWYWILIAFWEVGWRAAQVDHTWFNLCEPSAHNPCRFIRQTAMLFLDRISLSMFWHFDTLCYFACLSP